MRRGVVSNSASVAAWTRFRRELEPILKQG
jgi:hypothetical protein